jgi:hypothetical protein
MLGESKSLTRVPRVVPVQEDRIKELEKRREAARDLGLIAEAIRLSKMG